MPSETRLIPGTPIDFSPSAVVRSKKPCFNEISGWIPLTKDL